MTLEEKCYNEDVARNKGSRPPKGKILGGRTCTLPHEKLSPSEMRKLSSSAISTNEPCLWEEFYGASSEWKEAHLKYIVTTFTATFAMIEKYFVVGNNEYLLQLMSSNGIEPYLRPVPNRMKENGWIRFKNYRAEKLGLSTQKPSTHHVKKEVSKEINKTDTTVHSMNAEMTAHLKGDKDEILEWITKQLLLLPNKTVEINITIK